jgi:hypothetical protein
MWEVPEIVGNGIRPTHFCRASVLQRLLSLPPIMIAMTVIIPIVAMPAAAVVAALVMAPPVAVIVIVVVREAAAQSDQGQPGQQAAQDLP